jgi:hypothetical protein
MPDRMTVLYLLVTFLASASLGFGQDAVWQSPVPSQAEAAGLLTAVCPADIQTDPRPDENSLVCKPCPKFTGGASEDPAVAKHEFFAPRSAIYGSFTSQGTVEAVMSFEGCESHVNNFGGSVLLRSLAGSWTRVNYAPNMITTACHSYRLKTGRDLLLCEGDDHRMDAASQWVDVWDFSNEQAPQNAAVFGVVDNRVACGAHAIWGSIDKAELEDVNGDGMPDLILSVSVGQGDFAGSWGSCSPEAAKAPAQKLQLTLFFQPETNRFLPAPDSAATVERLEQLFHGTAPAESKPAGPGLLR